MTKDEKELIVLRIWKEDALEAIADHDRAYAAQGEMLKEMHGVLSNVAEALHDAQMCLTGYIKIKANYIPKIKRKKPKVSNVSGGEPCAI